MPLFWDMAPHREFVCIGLLKTKALAASKTFQQQHCHNQSIAQDSSFSQGLRKDYTSQHPNEMMHFPDKRCINTCGWKIACSHQLTMRIHCTNAKNVGETVAGRTRKAKRKPFMPFQQLFPKGFDLDGRLPIQLNSG